MAKLSIVKGATSVLCRIFLQDSSSTTGAGLTGLTSGSAGLVCYRARDDDGNAGGTAITLSAGTRGTWSSGGFVEKDATNMPGVYEFGIPNAAIATGTRSVIIMFKGATNLAPLPLEIELTGWDNQDAVHGGMTCLPNTAVTTNASLLTSGTGTDQLQVAAGIASADAKKINAVSTSSVTTINANQGTTQPINFTGTAGSALVKCDTIDIGGTAQTARDLGASVLLAAGQKVDVDTIKTNPVVNAGTITFPTGATLASTTNITAGTITTATNLTTNNDKTGYSIGTNGLDSGGITAAAKNAIADSILDRNMATGTDSGTDSTAVRTVRQALRILRNKASVAGGTLTVTKEDDTTASWTAAITTTAGNPVSAVDPT
jgi:hypothetical protein